MSYSKSTLVQNTYFWVEKWLCSPKMNTFSIGSTRSSPLSIMVGMSYSNRSSFWVENGPIFWVKTSLLVLVHEPQVIPW